MQVEYRKKFLKELSKLPNKYSKNIEAFVFEILPNFQSLEEIGKIEKMIGYKNYFKVRFGDYRVGLKREE
jgi:mRNA interferase RelE/StbE